MDSVQKETGGPRVRPEVGNKRPEGPRGRGFVPSCISAGSSVHGCLLHHHLLHFEAIFARLKISQVHFAVFIALRLRHHAPDAMGEGPESSTVEVQA